MLKTVIALVAAAGFASTSFAQTGTPVAAPAAKVTAPAAASAEKKMEAPKAVEPMKAETPKAAAPAAMETAKSETPKAATHHAKTKEHATKAVKTETKAEAATPAVK
ncbi:MAG: amine oxidase [Candidatus Accumulibacter necessarius]|jgi:hypothetical protein|uniref:amine oxidase n=1 Tax=Candidatus Accumulibacter necessarius TaxID=2954386 RepID=UPI002FC2F5F2